MTDGFYVVAVGVAHEPPVVAVVVLRPLLRRVQRLGSQADRRLVEGSDRGRVGSGEGEVHLAVGPHVLELGDPEVGLVGAVANGHPEIHQSSMAERGQHGVVEVLGSLEVSAVDAEVVDHVAIVAHAADIWETRQSGTRATTNTRRNGSSTTPSRSGYAARSRRFSSAS